MDKEGLTPGSHTINNKLSHLSIKLFVLGIYRGFPERSRIFTDGYRCLVFARDPFLGDQQMLWGGVLINFPRPINMPIKIYTVVFFSAPAPTLNITGQLS